MSINTGSPARTALAMAALVVAMYAPLAAGQGAAAQADVQVVLTQQKVRLAADGREVLEPAEKALPGDVIEYRATYTNRTKGAVRNLLATLPVPGETAFVPGSARPAGVFASTGRDYAAVPLKRRVRAADGREIEQDVPLSEYRSLQWKVGELAPGASTTVAARMRLEQPK